MIVAWTALISWPFMTILLFRVLSLPAALTTAIIGGYLLLPEQVHYKVPGLPVLGKETITTISVFIAASIVGRSQKISHKMFPRSWWGIGFLIVYVIGLFGTYLTNSDPVPFRKTQYPPLPVSDLPTELLGSFIFFLPFFLGHRFLATDTAQRSALKVLVGFGFLYSFLALFEIRMSPQLNNWIYGFFPHSFAQHIRNDGYRPLVFLNHGLWLAIFLATATLAAIGLSKASKETERAFYMLVAIWLYGTLFLTKSLGAFAITTIVGLIWLSMPRRLLISSLMFCLVVVLTYPVLRSFDLVPVDRVVELANTINPDRAGSLDFRIRNEDALLEHASERQLFGWGRFGRNLAVEVRGVLRVVPDGYWVIAMGEGGYVRYFSEFGLLVMGAMAIFFNRRRSQSTVAVTLMVVLTANMIDLLPNATITMLTWLWAGALAGRMATQPEDEALQETPVTDRRGPHPRPGAQISYRRDFK